MSNYKIYGLTIKANFSFLSRTKKTKKARFTFGAINNLISVRRFGLESLSKTK